MVATVQSPVTFTAVRVISNNLSTPIIKQGLQEVHDLFKGFVDEHRDNLDVSKVATGEFWHAKQAIEMGLVDELGTSDDILLAAAKDKQVFLVKFKEKRSVAEKIAGTVSLTAQSILSSLWEKQQTKF